MGVEYYLVCRNCKKYVDLHKSYKFAEIFREAQGESNHPKFAFVEFDSSTKASLDNYWTSRGIWFLAKHLSHEIEMHSDHDDDWFEVRPGLEEQLERK